jgi:hypothetical protein
VLPLGPEQDPPPTPTLPTRPAIASHRKAWPPALPRRRYLPRRPDNPEGGTKWRFNFLFPEIPGARGTAIGAGRQNTG